MGYFVGLIFVLTTLWLGLSWDYSLKTVIAALGAVSILLSAILAHSGWHWMSERASELVAYSFYWPAFDAAFFASLMRWLMLLVVVGAILWAMVQVYDRFLGGAQERELSHSPDTG